jgi:hypothetical protein
MLFAVVTMAFRTDPKIDLRIEADPVPQSTGLGQSALKGKHLHHQYYTGLIQDHFSVSNFNYQVTYCNNILYNQTF